MAKDDYFAKNTLEWLSMHLTKHFDRNSTASRAIHYLITQYVKEQNCLTKHFLFFYTEDGDIKNQLLEFGQVHQHIYFLPSSSFGKEEGELKIWAQAFLSKDRFFIDATHHAYNEVIWNKLRDNGVKACKLEKEVRPGTEDGIIEWEDERYLRWKQEAGDKYQIFLSPNKIPFDYYLVSDGLRILELGHYHTGDVERHTENGIHKLYLHRKADENVLKILGDHQDLLFNGDAASLVKLLTLSLEEKVTAPTDTYETPGAGPIDQVYPSGDTGSSNYGEKGGYDLGRKLEEEEYQRLKKNLDEVKKLLEKADTKLLNDIIDHLDLIKDALEKRDKKVTPNHLVGLIGERLVVLTLRKMHPDAQVEHVAYEVPAYDIEYEYRGTRRKIDVKSTIHSIREEGDTIPFFLKRSQYEYIRQNPDENYYITRLSLKDLGLEGVYDRHKDKLGIEFDKDELIEQIDADLRRYVNDQDFMHRFRRNRMSVRMNIPGYEEDFLEG